MRLRIPMLAMILTACGPAVWAADTMIAQVPPTAPVRTAPSQLRSAMPLDQQVEMLQQQVAVLQAQVNALLTAVRVTETGVVLQGPTVQIAGQSIDIRSDANLGFKAGSLSGEIAQNASMRTGGTLTVVSSGGTTLRSTGTLDLKGTILRLNGGNRPVATVGSGVQMQSATAGQIVNGSPNVFSE